MPTKKVVPSWGYKCLGFESDDNFNVTKILRTVCRQYYEIVNVTHGNKRVAKISSETFVKRLSALLAFFVLAGILDFGLVFQ